ncbi:hypothetical protein [Paenibacillus sp. 2KB_22]|uniref:hypothetical protein n=1 Tax=Paenibacillus sp. 2KB_22 TaxID=3232978 RepID=UPI003F9ADEC0
MSDYGTLHELNGRYALKFERFLHHNPEDVFLVITKPVPLPNGILSQQERWISNLVAAFDDGEGTTYEGTITELEKP